MIEGLFARKPINAMIDVTKRSGSKLKKVLGAFDLTLLGIGCVIGTGIFVLFLFRQAQQHAQQSIGETILEIRVPEILRRAYAHQRRVVRTPCGAGTRRRNGETIMG